ncbi:MAG: hypothetical protein JW880_04995 [Candidatus Thermoplasmatota archaeon]|nr:hypothetical protein [Candidatus Thermoplasmatota archaeon]
MTEEESILDRDLDKIVATSDPIAVVFELNEEMMWRVGRIRYVLTYAFWAGILVTLLTIIFMVWVALTDYDLAVVILGLLVIFASVIASGYARREKPFLDEYRVLASAVARAKNWQPNPAIPQGSNVLDRYLKYLAQSDDRFGYYFENRPKYLRRDFRVKRKTGEEIRFDAVLEGSSYPWDPVVEDVRVLVRTVPIATVADVMSMKEDSEYALRGLRWLRFVFKPGPARIVLVQTEREVLEEGVVEAANEHWVHYKRGLGGDEVDWSSPIELVAESESGTYNFGSIYFG